jgi:hypothetical protein
MSRPWTPGLFHPYFRIFFGDVNYDHVREQVLLASRITLRVAILLAALPLAPITFGRVINRDQLNFLIAELEEALEAVQDALNHLRRL